MITWVVENMIAIGDADDGREATQEKFDATLCVAKDLDICDRKDPDVKDYTHVSRHKVGMIDGIGNHPLTFLSAVLLLEALIEQGKRVLVHCHAGQSRSVMVVAAWMAYKGIATLDEALAPLLPLRKAPIYRQDMYALAQQALGLVAAEFSLEHSKVPDERWQKAHQAFGKLKTLV